MSFHLGAFELYEVIGRGGMGEVWRGAHVPTALPVAVKVLARKAWSPAHLEAFGNEVRAVAGLDHHGIIRVYDHGVIPASAQGSVLLPGSPYLVMELASKGSLEPLCGRSTWTEARSLLIHLLDALAHAHARGLVHRDLKPPNILLTDRGVVLSDFGLAIRTEDAVQRFGGISGTPGFMAPEQFDGDWRDLGPWTDLYSVGCLTHALLDGQPPFGWRAMFDARAAHQHLALPASSGGDSRLACRPG